jgi:hypothetical protein
LPTANPLFQEERFHSFPAPRRKDNLYGYSVGRTVQKGQHENFRKHLAGDQSPLCQLLNDATGKAIDTLDADLQFRKQFGTKSGQRGLRSALSKIAAFLAPQIFLAWDSEAKRGLRKLGCRFQNYNEYLIRAKDLLSGPVGQEIRATCKGTYPDNEGFYLRVLDQYLMRVGKS